MGIPDHLTCLLRNLYSGQEATVRTGHGTTDWFQIGKGLGYILAISRLYIVILPLYLIYRVHHVKCQAGWSTSWNKDCGEKLSNSRYADDTTLKAESEKELRAS